MPPETTWPPPVTIDTPIPGAPRSERVRRAVVATVAAGVLAASLGLTRPANSVGITIVLVASGAAIVHAGVIGGRSRAALVAAMVAFLPWLALRSSPWLLVPDLVAAGVLAVVAVSARNGSGLGDSASGYRRRAARALSGALVAPRRAFLGVQAEVDADWRQTIRQTSGPAVLGVAIAFLVAVVLTSGDALFASYLEVGDVVETSVGRFVTATIVMAVVVAASGAAAASELRPTIPARPLAAPRSAVIAVVPLIAVYVAYVIVQCSTLVLGADHVRTRTGLTFAEYARSGFFQLVAVGIVTFLGLTMLRPIIRRSSPAERRAIRALAVLATACTVAMVVAAIVKLDLYADVFGLTMLRMYTTVFAAWLGVALLIALWSLFRPDGEWIVPMVATTALIGVFAMNVVNPEPVVAEHNLTETIQSDEFDIDYLLNLSADAVPTIVAHLDELTGDDRDQAIAQICREHGTGRSGLDWNRSVSVAARMLPRIC